MADTEKIPTIVPLLRIRDVLVYPLMVLPLAVGRERSVRALEEAMATHRFIFLVTQKRVQVDEPQDLDLYSTGTVCEVLQLAKMPDGTLKILVEGIKRAQIKDFKFVQEKNYMAVKLEWLEELYEESTEIEALKRQTLSLFEQYVK